MNTYISFLKIIKSEIQSLLRTPRPVNIRLSIEIVLGSIEHLINDIEELNKKLETS